MSKSWKWMDRLFQLACIALLVAGIVAALSGNYAILAVFFVIAIPVAFYRKFISRRTRTVGSRPYVAGRDCPTCDGWGQVNGHTCPGICAGRKTR
jgi:hypothetical protein